MAASAKAAAPAIEDNSLIVLILRSWIPGQFAANPLNRS
jgi:hypothetical protein